MRHFRNISTCLWIFIFAFASLLLGAGPLQAQDTPNSVAPVFTAQTLEARIAALAGDTTLSDEQKAQIQTALRVAADRLTEATRQSERRAQFSGSVDNTEALQVELELELKAAQEILSAEPDPIEEMIGDEALFELEKELREKESDLAETETRLQALQDTFDSLTTRQASAPEELSEARAAASDLQTRLNALGNGELEALSEARRIEIQARLWYRRKQIQALEQEISTLASRQDLISGRRAVADVRAQTLRRDVARIGAKTGETRVNEARDLLWSLQIRLQKLRQKNPSFRRPQHLSGDVLWTSKMI